MILDHITLSNFGVYAGQQKVNLAPENDSKPIILFGGDNGGGKTTFLDAVQLALYGTRANCSGRGKLAYTDYLRDMIHKGTSPTEGAAVELGFRRTVDGETHHYRLTRSWHHTTKGIEESLQVTKNTEPDSLLSKHWDEYIESYIPCGIAQLFFFDAEQIKELAEGEHAAEILGTAIHTLLGLDIVDRLNTDLIALARRKRIDAKPTEERERARHAQDELDRLQKLLDQAVQEHGSFNNELANASKEVRKCEGQFQRDGGELFLKRASLESDRATLDKQLKEEENILRDIAAGPAPFLLISNLLDDTEAQARKEDEAHKSRLLAAAIEERDAKVIELMRKNSIPSNKLTAIKSLLQADRKKMAGSLNAPLVLNGGEHLAPEIHHLRTTVLPELKTAISAKLAAVRSLQESLSRCDLELGRTPSEDSIATIHNKLILCRLAEQEAKTKVAAQEDKKQLLAKQLESAKHQFERDLGQEVDGQVASEHNERVLKYSSRVRDVLSKFRIAVIGKHAEHLEALILESFTHLLHKRALVTGLKIDPTTFALELAGSDGKPLSLDRLSNGERQLLATAILWGLAKASGRPLPTIIDTPLGRLDSSHRRNLLDRYFPVASHQVILLSTDEEVDEASFARLNPHISRSYSFAYSEKTHSTTIKEGYFWNHESTH